MMNNQQDNAHTNPLLVRPADAARMLGLSRGRIYEILASGEIQSIKIGAARLIPVDSLRAWVNAHLAEEARKQAQQQAQQSEAEETQRKELEEIKKRMNFD